MDYFAFQCFIFHIDSLTFYQVNRCKMYVKSTKFSRIQCSGLKAFLWRHGTVFVVVGVELSRSGPLSSVVRAQFTIDKR